MIILLLATVGCSRQPDHRAGSDSDTAAQEAGKTAYKAVEKTKEAADKAARELGRAAQQAHEGWKEAERQSKSKPQTQR